MTLPEAARMLKLGPFGCQKLKRILLAAERRVGRRIGVRTGEKRLRWRVTLAQLHRYAPGLFDEDTERDDLRKAISAHLRDVDRKAEEVAREVVQEELVGIRSEMAAGDRLVLVSVSEVAAGVGKLARRIAMLEVRFAEGSDLKPAGD